MQSADRLDAAIKGDRADIMRKVREFPDQCESCWSDWKKISLPAHLAKARNILIAGMGGSSIGGALAAGLARGSRIPVAIWRDYGIPGWVDKDTLFIAISFSGNTEETLDSFKKAAARTGRLVTIASGGKLETLSRKHKATHYGIKSPGQPRTSFGFLFTSVLAVFSRLKLVGVSDRDFKEAIAVSRDYLKKIDVSVPVRRNSAKLLALKLENRIPVVFGSGSLSQVARRWCSEFSENAKSASFHQIIPEMNHNTFNGVELPANVGQDIFAILLRSGFDHPRNRMRQDIALEVLKKYRIPHAEAAVGTVPTPLAELLQFVLLGACVSRYLAVIYGVDPSVTEVVDYFKKRLAAKPIL
ncbi:MAG: bifunctional phosphoglucose/phosphomannose isomerase [Pseudomonadota bacterium]